MKTRILFPMVALLAVVMAASQARAEEFAPRAKAAEQYPLPDAAPRTPVAQTLESDTEAAPSRVDIKCLSGGIGEDEMQAMDAHASAYNLKTLFVSQGAFLSAVALRVSDSKGQPLFETTSKGPAVLLKLPSGRYMIEAKGPNGATLEQRVAVSETRLSSIVFRFPASEL